MTDGWASRVVVNADRALAERVRALAERRMVFVAGLPGTGKSLLVHQLVHVASGAGRRIHLLQWDVARPVFEASPAGQRYPLVDGVTHAVIRRAAGLWVRDALADWSERYPDPRHLLVGETPFVGNRFVELARPSGDRAEALLTSPSCRFVIATPSREVRSFLEAQRARRAHDPLHPREREDAPPHVLRDLWQSLAAVAGGDAGAPRPYDPAVYAGVYQRVLRHRNTELVGLEVILPTERLSVYDFAVTPRELAPTATEADRFIGEVERRYPDPRVLDGEIARWWQA
ncbi:MAG: hypothetical protein DME01_12340 [Candidatus Rokuibacteriota bacterium]|nr:MAG: hypothetical protein DME01_12340 [Candidatus Rokubacteria bacterium]